MYRFHPTAGPLIQFSNECRTAERLNAKTDFNGGLIFSEMKLETNTIFQVRVEKKVGIWSGGIELGVTCVNPNTFITNRDALPQSATEMRSGTWMMASSTILQDGEPIIDNYGFDLEKLEEGETVGLMRTKQGALVFFIQGVSQGVAVPFVPPDVYCIVNLYGKCAMVSLVDVGLSEQCTNTVEHVVHEEVPETDGYTSADNNSDNDKLRFHQNCGPLVQLSNNHRTAERRRPFEEFNNCVILTHRPLRDNELFQVRIDSLIHKWSGSIEFGLITHGPDSFNGSMEFPATLTVVRDGTVIMSGNGVLHDGKATNSPYTHFNLDQLQEGDRIGVMRRANGEVIYFVNGESHGESGVATNLSTTDPIWGCCNLYGMAAKVTIVDKNEREEHNLRVTTRNPYDYSNPAASEAKSVDRNSELLFHSNCGFHAAVINNGRTAHRPESLNDFNHGVVLTNRPLNPFEMFEIRLDKVVPKWAGSIEIGVTTHAPMSLEYPCTMTNVKTGTWMMTGNGIMHNGNSLIEDYGKSLDKLKIGDRVGVLRKENGNLHFFVNGADQGSAASGIPEDVYGVIDLYGQAAQATIISFSCNKNDENIPENDGRDFTPLKFHPLHGKNAKISNSGLTASRPNALGEFNAAIVISSRPLKDNELFEVVIERMVDRWSGNIEAGVTTIKPENLMFPNTMTDIDHDTIMLSGSSIMSGGNTITNSYACNLDCLTVGCKVGMMRKADSTLHFFINGEDKGVAATDVPTSVFAVIDLYGQCTQVSITRVGDMSLVSSQVVDSMCLPFNDTSHRFSSCCGKNIALKDNNLTASRVRHYDNALVFSSSPLDLDEIFEVRITEVSQKWAGALMIGVTSLNITDSAAHIPSKLSLIGADAWFVKGSSVFKNNQPIKDNYCVNLNRLCVGDRIGVKICADRSLKFYVNGEEMGCAAYNLPKKLHVVIDMFGSCESILITSIMKGIATPNECLETNALAESGYSALDDHSPVQPGPSSACNISSYIAFSSKHSRNIELVNGNMTARRTSGYQAFVFSNKTLRRGQTFEIRIDKLNPKWTSSLMIGVIECNPERICFPFNALGFNKACWLVMGENVFHNGMKTADKLELNLNSLRAGQTVGIMIDNQSNLHIRSQDMDIIVAKEVGSKCRALVVLYGEAEQVTIMSPELSNFEKEEDMQKDEKADKECFEGFAKPLEGALSKVCEYVNACLRFKASLCIPDAFFLQSEPVMCFCESCYKSRGESPTCKQGDPPVEYTVPLGWVRFPVNINFESCNSNNQSMTTSTSSLSNVLTTWHVAYHGLEISHVRSVMDYGQLIAPEYVPVTNKGKDEKTDFDEIKFSPSVEYATIPAFSPTKQFIDSKSKKKLSARVAFQILVQPGSYKVSCPSHSSRQSNFAPSGSDIETIEWSTKEQGSTHVSALLLRLDGFFN